MLNPGSKVAQETISIFNKGSYCFGDEKQKLLKNNLKAHTILTPHSSLPPLKSTPNRGNAQRILIFQGSSFEAAQWLLSETSSICVLDFASDSHPGGGWRGNQVGTQEEALCRQSDLGLRLEQHFELCSASKFMPSKSVVYLPVINVIRTNKNELISQPFQVSVVAAALRSSGDDVSYIRDKVQGVLRVAAYEDKSSVVLGAWGCGAFGNDTEIVAQVMIEQISNTNSFECAIFAIPKGNNFDIFYRALEEYYRVRSPTSVSNDFVVYSNKKVVPFSNPSSTLTINQDVKWLVLGTLLNESNFIEKFLDELQISSQQIKRDPKKYARMMLKAVKCACLTQISRDDIFESSLIERLWHILPPRTSLSDELTENVTTLSMSSNEMKGKAECSESSSICSPQLELSSSESDLRTCFLVSSKDIVNTYAARLVSEK